MHLRPAEYVISVFGGVRKTAKAIGRSASAVSKWKEPRERKGCEGRIPSVIQKQILNLADVFNLDITSKDLIEGREISGKNLRVYATDKTGIINKKRRDLQMSQAPQRKPIDTEWFFQRINQRHGSMRQIAPKMVNRKGKPLDVAAVSLMVHGKRSMQIDEACQLATLLKEPFIEVVRRTGVVIPN